MADEMETNDKELSTDSGIQAAMVQTFVDTVEPMLKQANPPAYAMKRWDKFVEGLRFWTDGKSEEEVAKLEADSAGAS